ncbi:MAG TPA: glycerophosphodiester phosphodiesterase family protein, partial [Thermoleophilaceae bacterium]|nr:glycerophosphodiester phosphodiesterase family protein [Thermoleophilaceae bacterium]
GARVNIEIKNQPTDNDFVPGSNAYANRVLDTIVASRLPRSQLMIQSFYPPNLDVAEARIPGVETSLLTLPQTDEGGPSFAKLRGYDWISPNWPENQAYVSEAHGLGLRVVPYTLNTRADIRAAARRSVDELITDDPALARRALRSFRTPHPPIPPPPSAAACERVRASRSLPTTTTYDREPGAPRVFAMQFKQELRHVRTYRSFRTKIECMVRERVVPRLARGRPNVVAFNEDIGLMTIATGTRGRPARQAFGNPNAPSCEPQGAPCATLGALAAVTAAYSKENAAYRARFGPETPVSDAFVAATDTFGRGWMQVFSDMARRYDVYILGSNNQPPFRESSDPTEIELFRDPDLPRPDSVFVATSDEVYNEVFMWGPRDVRLEGPQVLRNVVASNRKVPLTPIEQQIQLTPGASTGPDAVENVRPYELPGTAARISFATSLPAFVYGDPPPGTDPCSDTSLYYMRCLDRLGTNLVMQDEANPGRWAGDGGGGYWQPLEWMTSTWRAASDPTVDFDYNVTPHMVGNLADLAFDGQTAITQRGLGAGDPGAERCTYVGNSRFLPGEDPERARDDAGPKREFLAISPWVVPDGPRPELREVGAKLAPGSNDPLENDYVETAIAADLPFPPEPERPGCAVAQRGQGPGDGPPGDEPPDGGPSGGGPSGGGPGGSGDGDGEGAGRG